MIKHDSTIPQKVVLKFYLDNSQEDFMRRKIVFEYRR